MTQIVACLAGGRNKGMAAKAYEVFNTQLAGTRLAIRTPTTHYDVPLAIVPELVGSMGGHAVIKVPYANAGIQDRHRASRTERGPDGRA